LWIGRRLGAVEDAAYEPLDTTQPRPILMAVWKLIERERRGAQKREDEAARSKAASAELKQQRRYRQ
jgi:hypothetical protein